MCSKAFLEIQARKVPKLELERDTLLHALVQLYAAEKLDDDDPVLGEARARAAATIKYVTNS
jgi:hypothetical protein